MRAKWMHAQKAYETIIRECEARARGRGRRYGRVSPSSPSSPTIVDCRLVVDRFPDVPIPVLFHSLRQAPPFLRRQLLFNFEA